MFKRLLLLGSFAILPVAAKGSTPSDDAGMRTMSVATGQGAWLRITIPTHANLQQPVQAPYALTGASFTNSRTITSRSTSDKVDGYKSRRIEICCAA